MKKAGTIIFWIGIFFIVSCGNLYPCTSAIISGKVTPDGRPILWKNRDTDNLSNCVRYMKGEKFNFIAITSYENNPKSIWIGTNDVGFSIMNTQSYNLIENKEGKSTGDDNGILMKRALEICANIDDFRQFLDTLSRKPLSIEANFGVIDAEGNGAFFEVDDKTFFEFNVDDLRVAPHGYIVRTNFSISGKFKEGSGYIRYQQADRELFTAAASKEITPDWLIRKLSRSFVNPLMGIDLTNGQFNKPQTNGWFIEQDFIARKSTSCAVAVQGVKIGEDPTKTIMWTVIGYPPVTPLIPIWIKGAEKKLPRLLNQKKDDEKSYSSLCDAGCLLRNKVYSYKQGKNTESYFNWELLFNNKNDGFMQINEKIERELFTNVYSIIDEWRDKKTISTEDIFKIYDEADQFIANKFEEFHHLELE